MGFGRGVNRKRHVQRLRKLDYGAQSGLGFVPALQELTHLSHHHKRTLGHMSVYLAETCFREFRVYTDRADQSVRIPSYRLEHGLIRRGEIIRVVGVYAPDR